MLTHIVWWTFKPEAGGKSGAENANAVRTALQSLRGNIPELKELSVSLTLLDTTTENAELVLVTRHDNAEGLAAYAAHPEHQKVAGMIKEVVASRRAIDFME